MSDYKVISSDSHVFEPPDLWTSRIEHKFRDRAPQVVQGQEQDEWWWCDARLVAGMVFGVNLGVRFDDPGKITGKGKFEDTPLGGYVPDEHVKDMDADGVDAGVLFPSNAFNRHSPDRTTFPGYSSRGDAANYNLAFQGRQMRPDSLKFLLSWTNHRPAKRKISKPLVYDQVSSLGSPFALYDPVTVINPDAPKVD